jgi:hypothetical protein
MGIRAVPPKQAKKILTNRQTPLTAELGAERERESRTSYSPLALVASRRKLGRASRSFVPPKSHPHSRKSTAKRNATKQIAKKKSLKKRVSHGIASSSHRFLERRGGGAVRYGPRTAPPGALPASHRRGGGSIELPEALPAPAISRPPVFAETPAKPPEKSRDEMVGTARHGFGSGTRQDDSSTGRSGGETRPLTLTCLLPPVQGGSRSPEWLRGAEPVGGEGEGGAGRPGCVYL